MNRAFCPQLRRGHGYGLAYRYADGSTRTLAHTDEGLYFDMLPDGRLIYMLQKADANIGDPGIYTVTPGRRALRAARRRRAPDLPATAGLIFKYQKT